MLAFSAAVPHSPLLLPSIHPQGEKLMAQTNAAMDELAGELYASFPETILLISEHPTIYPDAFSIAIDDPYDFDVREFGQLSFEHTFHPDIEFIDRLQRSLRRTSQPVTLTSDETLSYAAAVPMQRLASNLKNVKLVPVTYCELPPKNHFRFGQALAEIVHASARRVAVIAAGDMSHALTSGGPAEFHKDGPTYDKKIQEIVSNMNAAGLLNMSPEMVQNAKEKNYRPLSILMGLLDGVAVKPHILSYEAPIGVGYLVVNFVLR